MGQGREFRASQAQAAVRHSPLDTLAGHGAQFFDA
jgi:hypothetical protein